MILRPYQNAISDAVINEWKEVDSTLVEAATGLGKTVIFSDIIRRIQPKRAMVLAHRKELIYQARNKIERITGLEVGVEMGEHKTSENNNLFNRAQVVVSSIQTQTAGGDGGGRMSKFNPMDFDVLFIDEAHRAASKSYMKVIEYYKNNPALKIAGFTATPNRYDEKSLGKIFESQAYKYTIKPAIKDGWLCNILQFFQIEESIDFSRVRPTATDLNSADLAAVMEAEKPLYGIADNSIEIIGDKRAIAFASSVNHARLLSDIYNNHRAGMSAWICDKTDPDERIKILKDFENGDVQVVCNFDILGEGFDNPKVHYIIDANPTRSRLKYIQRIGRITRPLEGTVDGPTTPMGRKFAISKSDKPVCTVLDYSGNSCKFKLMTVADALAGEDFDDDVIESAIIRARKIGKPVKMDLLLEEEEKAKLEREARHKEDQARKSIARNGVKAIYKSVQIDPFDLLSIKPVKSRGWDEGKQFSEKQKAFLRRSGVNPDAIPYAQGKQLMAIMGDRMNKNLCSIKQMNVLKKYGCDTNVSFAQASAMIDAIAKNNWRKPEAMPESGQPVNESNPEPVYSRAEEAFGGQIPF